MTDFQKQRCLTGTLATLAFFTLLCSFGLLFHIITLLRPLYKLRNLVSGNGWTWNPIEVVTIPVPSRPTDKVRHHVSEGLLDAFDALASSHIKHPHRNVCPKRDPADGEEPEPVPRSSCDAPDSQWFSTRASLARYKYETVAELMGLRRGHLVLDWGAGCGHAVDLLAGKRGFKAVAIDLADSNAEWGRQNLHNIDSFCALDGARLPFEDKSFDAILSNDALNRVMDQQDQCDIIKDQVMRVLRPGGCAWFGDMGTRASSIKKSEEFWKNGSCPLPANAALYTFREKAMFGLSHAAYSMFLCRDSRMGEQDIETFKTHMHHNQRHSQDIPHLSNHKKKDHTPQNSSNINEADDGIAQEDAQLNYTGPAKHVDDSQGEAAEDDVDDSTDDQQSADSDDDENGDTEPDDKQKELDDHPAKNRAQWMAKYKGQISKADEKWLSKAEAKTKKKSQADSGSSSASSSQANEKAKPVKRNMAKAVKASAVKATESPEADASEAEVDEGSEEDASDEAGKDSEEGKDPEEEHTVKAKVKRKKLSGMKQEKLHTAHGKNIVRKEN